MEQADLTPGPLEPARPKRPAISTAVAFGFAVGLVPYLLFIERPAWAPVYGALAVVVAMISLRSFESRATVKPSLGELILGGWNAVLPGSTVSLVGLFFYLVGYWVWRGMNGLLQAFDREMVGSAQAWGLWCSLVMVVPVALSMVAETTPEIGGKLYPSTAGMRSPYLSLIMERRTLTLLALATVAGGTVAIVYLEPGRWPQSLVLALALFYPSMAIENHERQPARPQKEKVVTAIAKLLNYAGYRTVPSPRTGRSDVDPFVTAVDLLAQSPQRDLIVEVKSRHRTTTPVQWESAARLRTAASAMRDALGNRDGDKPVEPLLIVVARDIAPSLESFSELESFPFFVIEDEAVIGKIHAENDSEALRKMALQHLGLEPVGPPLTDSVSEAASG